MKLFAKVLFLAVLGLGCQTLYTGAQSPDTKPVPAKPTARYPEKAETTKPATRYIEKPAAAASAPAVPAVPADIYEVQVAPLPPQPPQPMLPGQPPLPVAGARTVRGFQVGMPANPNAPATVLGTTSLAQSGSGMFYMTVDSHDAEAVKLTRQLTDAKTDADKDKLKDKIKDLLVKQFDERQKRHEKELEALEAQVKKLKEMVNKRQDNKREIIDERMKQLQRDAQGLGW